jgi:hypothetical protein
MLGQNSQTVFTHSTFWISQAQKISKQGHDLGRKTKHRAISMANVTEKWLSQGVHFTPKQRTN